MTVMSSSACANNLLLNNQPCPLLVGRTTEERKMFKRLLARLFGRKLKPDVVVLACKPADLLPRFPQFYVRSNRQPRTIVVSTPSGRDDNFYTRPFGEPYTPIFVDATTIGDTTKRDVLAACGPVSSHHHHNTGSYDSGSSDSGSSSSYDLGKEMEPTKEMISAGEDVILNTCGDVMTDPERARENATSIFNAMMAASPMHSVDLLDVKPLDWFEALSQSPEMCAGLLPSVVQRMAAKLVVLMQAQPLVVIPTIWKHYPGAKVANIYEQAMNDAGVKWRSVDDKVNGWIDWHGGMFRPVRSDTIVDVMFANGNVKPNICAGSVVFEWQKTPKDSQRVTAYRLHTDKG